MRSRVISGTLGTIEAVDRHFTALDGGTEVITLRVTYRHEDGDRYELRHRDVEVRMDGYSCEVKKLPAPDYLPLI